MNTAFSSRARMLLLIAGTISCTSLLDARQLGSIYGNIKDSETKEPLPFANTRIDGTAIGAATDRDGNYRIPSVPPGTYVLIISYVGFETRRLDVRVGVGAAVQIDVDLKPTVIQGQEMVVTALLEGQARAINQQLTSKSIVNVVSADKIQELPDKNAAEALARLPGISIERDGGEAQKVVVRGLAPKYNSVTLNGERLPSTDPEDRSLDLSTISPEIIGGIEVFKSLTADKDADAIGGTINLEIRKASAGLRGNVKVEGGYNDYANEYGQYKLSFMASDRILDGALGFVVSGNTERANRSSDVLEADYKLMGEAPNGKPLVEVDNLNLVERNETRKRYGGGVTLDYDFAEGSVLFNSFFSRTDRDEVRRRIRYRVGTSRVEPDFRDRQSNTTLWSNSLSAWYQLDVIDVRFRGSYSQSILDIPFQHSARFEELSAFTQALVTNRGPDFILQGAKHDPLGTTFKESNSQTEKVKDRDLTASLDFTLPFVVDVDLAGTVSWGGKFRGKVRSRDNTSWWTQYFNIDYFGLEDRSGRYQLDNARRLLLASFLDPGISRSSFLDDRFSFKYGVDRSLVNGFLEEYRYYQYTTRTGSLYRLNPLVDVDDYEAGEDIAAGYLMLELNLGRQLMLLPGLRYEQTSNDFKSIFGIPNDDDDEQQGIGTIDTSGKRSYGSWLPSVQVRYKATDWFDVRAAYTHSLSRPDYSKLVPWERINSNELTMQRGNPNLLHARARNYDLSLSFYGQLGLLTVGGFYKNVYDVEYIRTYRLIKPGAQLNGYSITEPVNATEVSTAKGIEVELQTNFTFLPSPLDGIVLYANYSVIASRTVFPMLLVRYETIPPFRVFFRDTIRVERMPGQADRIANISVGYEKGGFRGRISLVYQGSYLKTLGTRNELDGYNAAFWRWDFTGSQQIMKGFSLFFNANNISNHAETAFLNVRSYETKSEVFGWTADFGVRYSF